MTTPTTPTVRQRANHLVREKSPYLLQHAHNPVDWHAWGEEAFAKARAGRKPVFLSIGYSTCHWCHVMERESFEDEAVARFLNEHFVSIKVDREERPDVDKIYMTFVQATTGSGGWPLNVFLTPDLKPFFGGTYFPPENRHGRGSFLSVLQQIQKVWQERHGEVASSADEIHARLEAATASSTPSNLLLTADVVRRAGAIFKNAYDPRNGGFGSAPKFPQPSQPAFLLRYANRFKDDEAARMVLHTCDRMAAGGIHDQLGGGFARYSVDAKWLVPHFEKMLYDNAQLTHLYLDAYLAGGESRHAGIARAILDYILRDMTHPEGGFYSAEDADSEGHEGKFYCWTCSELSALLSPEEYKVAARHFGLTEEGNFVDHSHPTPLPGQNVLSVVEPNLADAEVPLLASARRKMTETRSQRIRPHRDDKILASWNGLMLGAMARAYAVLGDEKYRVAAERNLAFIQQKLWMGPQITEPGAAPPLTPSPCHEGRDHLPQLHGEVETGDNRTARQESQDEPSLFSPPEGEGKGERKRSVGTLYHRWRDGEHDQVQLLEAYAFLLEGVVHLYEATLEPRHLDYAIALAEAMIAKFCDSENGGFWQSAAEATGLILRLKDDYDGAEPSGNSVATLALLKLAAITGRADFRKPAEGTLRLFAARLATTPQAVPYMLHALDFWLEEPRRVVIAGDSRSTHGRTLLRAAHSVYQPNRVVLGNAGPVNKFAKTLPVKNGPAAYVCTSNECRPPTHDGAELRRLLRDP